MVNCINDVTSQIGLNIGGTTVSWVEPTATDNSGVVSLSSRSRAPGSFFVVGSTDVTYVFVDGSGNTAACTFSVNVVEGKFSKRLLWPHFSDKEKLLNANYMHGYNYPNSVNVVQINQSVIQIRKMVLDTLIQNQIIIILCSLSLADIPFESGVTVLKEVEGSVLMGLRYAS